MKKISNHDMSHMYDSPSSVLIDKKSIPSIIKTLVATNRKKYSFLLKKKGSFSFQKDSIASKYLEPVFSQNQKKSKKLEIKKARFLQIENFYPFFFRDGHKEKGKKIIIEATKLLLSKTIPINTNSIYGEKKPKLKK